MNEYRRKRSDSMLVETNWQGEKTFETQNNEGNTLKMSSGDDAVSPMEALLGALSGCTMIDAISILGRFVRNDQLKNLRVEAEGERNDKAPRYFTKVTLTFHVEGDLPAEDVWKAMRQSDEKFCSVRHSMTSDVELKLILNGEETPEVN